MATLNSGFEHNHELLVKRTTCTVVVSQIMKLVPRKSMNFNLTNNFTNGFSLVHGCTL